MTRRSLLDRQDRAVQQLCVRQTESHFGVLKRSTLAGSDDRDHISRRRRVYRYLRLRHRKLGNAAHLLTRIRLVTPIKLDRH